MIYDQCYQAFLILTKEEKKQKLFTILEEFQAEEFHQEVIDLLNSPDVSENYLNALYEAIMKPLSEQVDKSAQLVQIQTSLRSLHFDVVSKESNTDEVDSLLMDIEN